MEITKPKTRIRKRPLEIQLQQALNAVQALDGAETNELTIARMKLAQTRLTVLAKMQARERFDEIQKLKGQLADARAENDRLRIELAQALAGHKSPVTVEIEQALAKYTGSRRNHGSEV
jgi:hypothetical protein